MKLIVIVLIVANVLATLQGFKDQLFFNKYKFQILNIQRGETYRMITSGFLHVDYIHLGFNMYALYLFSDALLHFFSILQFLIIYGASLFIGNYLTQLVHKAEPYYSAVGASGAVTGVVYASIVLLPNMTMYMFPIPFPIKAYIFGIGYLLYSIYGMKNQVGSIGHTAHLGGAVAGFVLAILFKPSVLQSHPLQLLLMALPIAALVYMQKKNLFQ